MQAYRSYSTIDGLWRLVLAVRKSRETPSGRHIYMKEEVSPPWWTVGEGYLTHDPPFDPKPLSERKRMGWTDHVADGALARPT